MAEEWWVLERQAHAMSHRKVLDVGGRECIRC